jgi:hypothetical protein
MLDSYTQDSSVHPGAWRQLHCLHETQSESLRKPGLVDKGMPPITPAEELCTLYPEAWSMYCAMLPANSFQRVPHDDVALRLVRKDVETGRGGKGRVRRRLLEDGVDSERVGVGIARRSGCWIWPGGRARIW